jgi:hypothetical protein
VANEKIPKPLIAKLKRTLTAKGFGRLNPAVLARLTATNPNVLTPEAVAELKKRLDKELAKTVRGQEHLDVRRHRDEIAEHDLRGEYEEAEAIEGMLARRKDAQDRTSRLRHNPRGPKAIIAIAHEIVRKLGQAVKLEKAWQEIQDSWPEPQINVDLGGRRYKVFREGDQVIQTVVRIVKGEEKMVPERTITRKIFGAYIRDAKKKLFGPKAE